jgi:hypothetical protein
MSLNQITNIDNNKYLPQVYLSNVKTDGVSFQNSNISGYIPSVLNTYEELDLNGIVSTGCLARACDFSIMRIGRHITVSFEGFNSSPQVSTGSGTLNFDGLIPPKFRPEGIDNAVIRVNVAGSEVVGLCQVSNNGNLRIFASVSGTGWTVGQLINVQGFSIVYTTP